MPGSTSLSARAALATGRSALALSLSRLRLQLYLQAAQLAVEGERCLVVVILDPGSRVGADVKGFTRFESKGNGVWEGAACRFDAVDRDCPLPTFAEAGPIGLEGKDEIMLSGSQCGCALNPWPGEVQRKRGPGRT